MIDPTDPNYNAVKKPNHKLLSHGDYDVSGEYIGIAQAHQIGDTPNTIVEEIPSAKIDFWLSEVEYAHNGYNRDY